MDKHMASIRRLQRDLELEKEKRSQAEWKYKNLRDAIVNAVLDSNEFWNRLENWFGKGD